MKSQAAKKNKQQSLVLPATRLPVLGLCGLNGEGLTALIAALLPELLKRGLQIAVVHHKDQRLVAQPDQEKGRRSQAAGNRHCFIRPGRSCAGIRLPVTAVIL